MEMKDFADLRNVAYAFQESRALLTAFELGVFSALEEGEKQADEVARVLGTDPRATDRLLNALCAMGLLSKSQNTYSNSSSASRFLVRGKPEYMGGLLHTVHLWDTWSTLTAAVRKGTAVAHREVNDRGDQWLTAFIAAMHDRASKQADKVVAGFDLSGVTRVLDVGGGSGAYAMAFVRAKEGIHATVFDLPNVLSLTRSYVQKEGLLGRISFTSGDYTDDDIGSGFDLVFLSAIVHSNSPDVNRALIGKCAGSLVRGGCVVVQDFIMDEKRTHPAHGALFALNMLVGTEAGDTYTEGEVRSWMEQAGLTRCERRETPFGITQIIGWKS